MIRRSVRTPAAQPSSFMTPQATAPHLAEAAFLLFNRAKRVGHGGRLRESPASSRPLPSDNEASLAESPYRDTALRYLVEDLPSASLPGARLQGILESLRLGRRVTQLSLAFLQKEGLEALHRLATGQVTYESFREAGLAEQAARIEVAGTARRAAEAEDRARNAALRERANRAAEQAEAARLARERDPKFLAKTKQRELRARYGIDTFIDEDCFARLMAILKRVDSGQRMSGDDFVWLSTAGDAYFSDPLRAAYHRLEAEHFAGEYKKTRDAWAAVKASSHYRKCGGAIAADSLLGTISVEKQNSPKLKSALRTTHGGVMRDLGRWNEALQLGEQAHAYAPKDYRPCTLLGAVHMQMGNYERGQGWYAKAVERGASEDSVDQDLRSIFFQAYRTKQAAMREFLLAQDPVRYAWTNPKPTNVGGKPGGPTSSRAS
jgi:tetratricopeptide (TPR) repeat protein